MLIKKIKSSSIIEVVISLVIFSIVFGLALSLVYRLNGKKIPIVLEARLTLNQELIKTKNQNTLVTESYELGDFYIEKEISNFNESLVLLKLTAYKNEKKIDEISEVLHE